MKDFYKLLFLQIFIILISSKERRIVEDLFDGLYNKDIYSGYLETDVEGHELFFILTPSQSDPENDPLLLWLNGGPGCSSLEGFLTEIGPVLYNYSQQTFILNEYAWNKNASILFIESPAGVGFTKIVNKSIYYNDTIQAVSLHIALQNFFDLFDEYQGNDFYITGESYAGTYIPHLVKEILKYSEQNSEIIPINLKGFLIGNPYTLEETDFEDSMIEFGYSHGLIGYRTFKNYLNECPHLPQKEIFILQYKEKENYTFDPYINDFIIPWKNVTRKCNEIRNEIRKNFEGINFYGILKECRPIENYSEQNSSSYKNIDYEDSIKHTYKYTFLKSIRKQYYLRQYENYKKKLRTLKEEPELEEDLEYAVDFFPACGEDITPLDFLNNKTVKEKLGVDQNLTFDYCSSLFYKWGDSFDFYKNDLPELTKKGFKAWLFSGTEDIAVATLGTLRWIDYLNQTIVDEWKPWEIDNQVAGMTQSYSNGLRFLTIKNCGHMVPEDRPVAAKAMLDKFLSSEN